MTLVEFNVILNLINLFDLSKNDFTIFGSGPIYPFKLKLLFRDADIVVTNKGWNNILKHKNKYSFLNCKQISRDGLSFFNGRIEVFKEWRPGGIRSYLLWNTKRLINTSLEYNGYKFVKLDNVLLYKMLLGRSKDKKDISKITWYLNTQKQNYALRRVYNKKLSITCQALFSSITK